MGDARGIVAQAAKTLDAVPGDAAIREGAGQAYQRVLTLLADSEALVSALRNGA